MKYILIDLGDTVFYNIDLSFIQGGYFLYDMIKNPKPDRATFMEQYSQLIHTCYEERREIEIPFSSFLRYLARILKISYRLPLKDVEQGYCFSFSKNELVPGVDVFLRDCHEKGMKVVALSNSAFHRSTLCVQLECFGILSYFTEVLSSADWIFRKPSISYFDIGVKTLDCDKKDILFIGNDYHVDVLGAEKAGIPCAWLQEKPEEHPIQPSTFIIRSYQELIAYSKGND
ncbi:MAG: HAD family hydrolase [Bacilli bacterium]|nr:HAD family hydrolase [Bacilli bacterium]